MERLTNAAELLDGPLNDPEALAGNLRDLRRINRWLGGAQLSRRAIDSLAADRADLSVLDIGTGGADIPLALLAWAGRRGQAWTVVAIDSRPEVLRAALRVNPALASTDRLQLRVGDGRSLPYADRTFDVAHTSLVLHHLGRDAALELLREMARVARLGVVVNDLHRGRLGWVGAWLLGHLLTSNAFTRHDAPLSVQRAYRVDEMTSLLQAAGLTPVRTIRGTLGQRYAIAARLGLGDGEVLAPPVPSGAAG